MLALAEALLPDSTVRVAARGARAIYMCQDVPHDIFVQLFSDAMDSL
jgi:uncharacterized protein (DUF2336 family)